MEVAIWLKEGDGFLRQKTKAVASIDKNGGTVRYAGGAGRPSLIQNLKGNMAIVVSTKEQPEREGSRIHRGMPGTPALRIEVLGTVAVDERDLSPKGRKLTAID